MLKGGITHYMGSVIDRVRSNGNWYPTLALAILPEGPIFRVDLCRQPGAIKRLSEGLKLLFVYHVSAGQIHCP